MPSQINFLSAMYTQILADTAFSVFVNVQKQFITIHVDEYEFGTGAAEMNEAEAGNAGFRLRYFQTSC